MSATSRSSILLMLSIATSAAMAIAMRSSVLLALLSATCTPRSNNGNASTPTISDSKITPAAINTS
ncbi:hypothetical protein D3C75_1076480 [compost metagenome]